MLIGLLARRALAAAMLGSHASAVPSGPAPDCLVARVVDGDTFYCRDGRKVRLLGVDSPERGQGASWLQAQRALARLMPIGRTIRLEGDVAGTDRYGRVLAWVWVGGTLVNEAMVRDGWAVRFTVPPNVKYADRVERAQNEARARRAGLWSSGGFACLPRDYRRGACIGSP
jgi:micrococcal nuclease